MERRAQINVNPGTGSSRSSGTVVDAKTSLALWLRAGRCQKGLSLDEVARKTKIQARILEQLESGKLEGLPADVFVRGFVRSVAKCVGLDEDEALRRYGAIGLPAAPVAARALIETMSDLAPSAARTMPRVLRDAASGPEVFEFAAGSMSELAAASTPIEPAETFMLPSSGTLEPVAGASAELPVEAAPESVDASEASKPTKKKAARSRGQGAKKARGAKRKAMATGTPFEPTPIVPDMVVALPPAGLVEAISSEQPVIAPVVEEAPMLAVEATMTTTSAIDWSQPLESRAVRRELDGHRDRAGRRRPRQHRCVGPEDADRGRVVDAAVAPAFAHHDAADRAEPRDR